MPNAEETAAIAARWPNGLLRHWGLADYQRVHQAMIEFTQRRVAATADELWLVEHPPVFTLGLNAKREHLLTTSPIAVVATDRGGQVTYHGPGQIILYTLLDLRRHRLGVRQLVTLLEQAAIAVADDYGMVAKSRPDAPGVYLQAAKLASLGLRVRRGCSYHGLSLNVAMDLTPFSYINPCGYAGLTMTQLADHGVADDPLRVGMRLAYHFLRQLPTVPADAIQALVPDARRQSPSSDYPTMLAHPREGAPIL